MQDASPKLGEPAAATALSARVLAWRRRLYEIVEHGPNEDLQARIFDIAIISLIFLNIAAFVAETVPAIEAAHGRWLYAFEVFSIAVFTVEYALRLWTAVEVPFLKRMPAWQARLTFARRPSLIIDLLAILPFYLAALLSIDLRVLRVLRLLRFLKLSRYSPALHTLIRVLQNERRALMGAGLLLLAAVLMASTGIYYLEGAAQPDKFGSVPDAAWWAMATLTTVGYGDVTPITPLGKLFGGVVMICGLCILALPVAIVSSGFAQEVNRHDFVINWSLMSRIPLLAELESKQVANVMPLLHAHNLPPGVELIRDGSHGDAMYFVAHGQVRQRTAAGEQTLAAGDFFGALALLENDVHHATVVTVSKCRLLKLYKQDFHRLESASPSVAAHIRLASTKRA